MGNCVNCVDARFQVTATVCEYEDSDNSVEDSVRVISNVQEQTSPQNQRGTFRYFDLVTPRHNSPLSASNVQEQISQSQSPKFPQKTSFLFEGTTSVGTSVVRATSSSFLNFVSSRPSKMDVETDSEEKSGHNDWKATHRCLSVPVEASRRVFLRTSGCNGFVHGQSMSDEGISNRFLAFKYANLSSKTQSWGPGTNSTRGSVTVRGGSFVNPRGSSCSRSYSRFGSRCGEVHRRRHTILSPKSTSEDGVCVRKMSPMYKIRGFKPKHITDYLRSVLIKCSLFKGIDSNDVAIHAINEVIEEMYTRDLNKDSILVKQGDKGDAFFFGRVRRT